MMSKKEKLMKMEKGLIYKESLKDDSELFICNEEPTHDVHVHITIPATGLQLEALFQAEELLLKAGVTFDTGYGCGGRDWEFDWSLKGAYVKLRKVLTETEQKMNWLHRNLFNGCSGEPNYLSCTFSHDEFDRIYIIVHGKRERFFDVLESKLLGLGFSIIHERDGMLDEEKSKQLDAMLIEGGFEFVDEKLEEEKRNLKLPVYKHSKYGIIHISFDDDERY